MTLHSLHPCEPQLETSSPLRNQNPSQSPSSRFHQYLLAPQKALAVSPSTLLELVRPFPPGTFTIQVLYCTDMFRWRVQVVSSSKED